MSSQRYSISIITKFLLFINLMFEISCVTFIVSTSSQLLNAIHKVRPGDVIHLTNSTFKGAFRIERSGNANALIVLQGDLQTIISNREGIGFFVKRANYWHFKDFMIINSRKGMIFEKSNNNIIENVKIENIDEEGIHIYDDSTDNVIRHSQIMMTGIKSATHGEAIVIGRDYRHWSGRHPDQSDRNIIINNSLGPGFSIEMIVLNEGTCCGLLARNLFDGHGMANKNGYGCWVKIKGDRYRIEHNTGISTLSEGFMVIRPKETKSRLRSDLREEMGGCENIFEQNSCDLQSNGYCIKVVDGNKCGNVVYSDNAYSDGLALTNIPVTRKQRSYKFHFITNEINFALVLAYTFLPFLFIIFGLIIYFCPFRSTNNTVLTK